MALDGQGDNAAALRRLKKQLRDNFATGYLTMVSIVLGVALTVLAEQALGKEGLFLKWDWGLFLRALMMFLIICGTFHYYYFFVSFVKVMPLFTQTFLPFLLGGSLVVLALRGPTPGSIMAILAPCSGLLVHRSLGVRKHDFSGERQYWE